MVTDSNGTRFEKHPVINFSMVRELRLVNHIGADIQANYTVKGNVLEIELTPGRSSGGIILPVKPA